MAITESRNLAGKLEECAYIAALYAEESDERITQNHYKEISEAIEIIKNFHIGRRTVEAITIGVEFND